MPLEIRPALADELVPCAELFARIATEGFYWLEEEHRTAEAMLGTFNEEEVFVAVRDGEMAGFLSLSRADAFVHSLFVETRGEGVGPALLMRAIAEVGGPVSLKCADENRAARRFYDRLGFVEIDRGEDMGHSWTRLRSP
jgi:GNAT superfamily N-acetyltransferase